MKCHSGDLSTSSSKSRRKPGISAKPVYAVTAHDGLDSLHERDPEDFPKSISPGVPEVGAEVTLAEDVLNRKS